MAKKEHPASDLFSRFLTFLEQNCKTPAKTPILVAVSGGADSVALLKLLVSAGAKLGVAHINFDLRGEESDKEQAFTQALALKLELPFFTIKFETAAIAQQKKLSIQETARLLRYEWLEEIRKTNGFHRLATAHHADDQAETLLLNVSNGTGIRGVRGMLPIRDTHIRPLLFATKMELTSWLEKDGQPWMTDSSNLTNDYTRNFLRNEIFQSLNKVNPSACLNFAKTAFQLREAEAFYEEGIHLWKKRVLKPHLGALRINMPEVRLSPAPATLLHEILSPLGFSKDTTEKMLSENRFLPGKTFSAAGHQLIADRNTWYILPLGKEENLLLSIDDKPRNYKTANLFLRTRVIPVNEVNVLKNSDYAFLDFEKLQFPLLLRPWKRGDYFYPLGLKKKGGSEKPGKMKVSDFLTNQKIPAHLRPQMPTLFSGEHLAWVLGQRIDARFAISPATKTVFCIRIVKSLFGGK